MNMIHKIENITFNFSKKHIVGRPLLTLVNFTFTKAFHGNTSGVATLEVGEDFSAHNTIDGVEQLNWKKTQQEIYIRLCIFFFDSFKGEYEARAAALMGEPVTHVQLMRDDNVDAVFTATEVHLLTFEPLDEPIDNDAVILEAKQDYFAILEESLRDDMSASFEDLTATSLDSLTPDVIKPTINRVLENFMAAEFQRHGQRYQDNIFAMEFYRNQAQAVSKQFTGMAAEVILNNIPVEA